MDRLGHLISTADLIASDAAEIDPLPAAPEECKVMRASWDAMRKTWRVAAGAPKKAYGVDSAAHSKYPHRAIRAHPVSFCRAHGCAL